MAELMTTRELAAYLRIKERKVYELAAGGHIPCARVTGKLLFPRHRIEHWVAQNTEGPGPGPATPPPPIIAGSHDPLLDWAMAESGSDLAMLTCGSAAGLTHLAEGRAVAAGLHLLDTESGEYNVAAIRHALAGLDVVAVQWAWRRQGLVLAPGNPKGITSLKELTETGARIVHRQDGAGSRLLFLALLERAGLEPGDLSPIAETPKSEIDLGLCVQDGRADAGLAIEAVAHQLGLDFVALASERYDLVLDRRDYFEPAIQNLLEFAASNRFQSRAAEAGGYDIEGLGRIVYNAP